MFDQPLGADEGSMASALAHFNQAMDGPGVTDRGLCPLNLHPLGSPPRRSQKVRQTQMAICMKPKIIRRRDRRLNRWVMVSRARARRFMRVCGSTGNSLGAAPEP